MSDPMIVPNREDEQVKAQETGPVRPLPRTGFPIVPVGIAIILLACAGYLVYRSRQLPVIQAPTPSVSKAGILKDQTGLRTLDMGPPPSGVTTPAFGLQATLPAGGNQQTPTGVPTIVQPTSAPTPVYSATRIPTPSPVPVREDARIVPTPDPSVEEATRELYALLDHDPVQETVFAMTPNQRTRTVTFAVDAPLTENLPVVEAWLDANGFSHVPEKNLLYIER